jgi:hypothetical protein
LDNEAHLAILKRVGAVLVAVGVIDIAYMIYCIVNRMSYSSSLNLFAIIAGILLMRGGLKTAMGVRWFGTFMLSAFVALLVAWPAIQPIGLTIMQIRVSPGVFVGEMTLVVFTLGLLFWVLRELAREPIQAARDAAGLKRRDMRIPAALGIGVLVAAGIGQHLLLGGESAERAKSMAEKEVGPGYRFHVSSINIFESSRVKKVSGVVSVWNDKGVKDIPVRWEENRN